MKLTIKTTTIILAMGVVPLLAQSAKFSQRKVGSCAAGPVLKGALDVGKAFTPSGWMGDGEGEKGKKYIQMVPVSSEKPRPGHTDGLVTRIHYQPGGIGWAGVYWLWPANNWGDKPPKQIQGDSKITFWAAGKKGGEIVEFKAGGVSGKSCQDSLDASTGKIALSKDWKHFEIPLQQTPGAVPVIGAFAWVASAEGNADGVTFYIDAIRYE